MFTPRFYARDGKVVMYLDSDQPVDGSFAVIRPDGQTRYRGLYARVPDDDAWVLPDQSLRDLRRVFSEISLDNPTPNIV